MIFTPMHNLISMGMRDKAADLGAGEGRLKAGVLLPGESKAVALQSRQCDRDKVSTRQGKECDWLRNLVGGDWAIGSNERLGSLQAGTAVANVCHVCYYHHPLHASPYASLQPIDIVSQLF